MVCYPYARFCPIARLHDWLCRRGLAQSSACKMLNFMCRLCPEYWREWKIVNEVLRGVGVRMETIKVRFCPFCGARGEKLITHTYFDHLIEKLVIRVFCEECREKCLIVWSGGSS